MKRILAIALLAAVVFTLTGCSLTETGKYMKAECTRLIDAIIAGDADAAYAIIADTADRDEFDADFRELHGVLEGTEDYSLSITKLNMVSSWGGEGFTNTVVLRMKCDAGVFQIDMEDTEHYDTIEYLNITQVE